MRTLDQVTEQIEKLTNGWTDENKAKLAAEILNQTDFNINISAEFFTSLSDAVHDELVGRAANEEDRPL